MTITEVISLLDSIHKQYGDVRVLGEYTIGCASDDVSIGMKQLNQKPVSFLGFYEYSDIPKDAGDHTDSRNVLVIGTRGQV